MISSQFSTHFNLLADQPDAVAKMRKLVLQLAVQCRLGDGSPGDGSAKQKLGAAIELISGQHLIPGEYNKDRKGIPYLTGPADFGPKFPTASRWTETPKVVARKGDVLLTVKGAGVGKTNVVKDDKLAISRQLMAVRSKTVDSSFIDLSLRAAFDDFQAASNGIAIPGISRQDVLNYEVWIPPLAEQRRIVAKVDELMALCDKLEQRQQARQHASGILQQSALHHLLAAREPQTFAVAWQRVRDHFHLLHDTPDAIPQLHQAILQLAVQGRLVPQNPKDESGQKVIERLSRRELPDTDHVLDENFPSAWGITSFTNLAHIRSGVTKGRNLAGRKVKAFPYLRVANVQRGFLELDVMKDIEIPVEELEKFRLQPNDLLITEGGDWDKVGRTAIWRGEVSACIHQNHVFRGRLVSSELLPEWFMLYFNSPVGRRYFESASKQTTNLASINATELRGCPVPIPPLTEQKRIVARVEELLRWCDTLEAQLHQTRTLGAHLLASTLHHLLLAA